MNNANPLNYARGLLDEIQMSTVGKLVKRKASALEQLAIVAEHLAAFDVSELGEEIAELKASTVAEVEAALTKSK